VCGCEENTDKTSGSRSAVDEDAARQIRSEIEQTGRKVYLQRINSAARQALAQMPGLEEVDKLTGAARLFVERTSVLVTDCLEAPSWDDTQIARFSGEMSWWRLSASVATVAMQRDNGGGITPATNCEDQYEQCLGEHNCLSHGWFCVCCVPCSLQYMRCMSGMIVGAGGFRYIA
jgi:hypothetical protein